MKFQAGFLQKQAPQNHLASSEAVTGLSPSRINIVCSFFPLHPKLTKSKQTFGDFLVPDFLVLSTTYWLQHWVTGIPDC